MTTNVSIPDMNMLKNVSTLAVSVPINLSIKLDLVSVNIPRETNFVDALYTVTMVLCNKGVFNLFGPRANLHLSYKPAGRSHYSLQNLHRYIKH